MSTYFEVLFTIYLIMNASHLTLYWIDRHKERERIMPMSKQEYHELAAIVLDHERKLSAIKL